MSLKVRLKGDKLVVKKGLTFEFDLVPFDKRAFSLGGTSAGTMEFREEKDGTTTAFLDLRSGTATLNRVPDSR